MGKHPCEIFKNTFFKEHLRTAASELALRSIVWKFVSGSHLKPSRLKKKLVHMLSIYLTPTLSCEPTISFIIFSDFSMFYQIFLSPQVKRYTISTYKHGIFKFLHMLPNDLRLRILEN